METLLFILPWVQITLAVILIIVILLQQRSAGVGAMFGGNEGTIHYERRGFEKTLFRATVVIAIMFVSSVFIEVFINSTPTIARQENQISDTMEDVIGDVTVDADTEAAAENTEELPPLEDFAQ